MSDGPSIVLSSFRARQEAQERDLAVEALKVSDGCVSAAARLCGLNRISFRRIIVRYSLQSMLKAGSRANRTLRGNAAWRALADV
jgi:transcriptional regulator with GAF, ATPase, and Fis domain